MTVGEARAVARSEMARIGAGTGELDLLAMPAEAAWTGRAWRELATQYDSQVVHHGWYEIALRSPRMRLAADPGDADAAKLVEAAETVARSELARLVEWAAAAKTPERRAAVEGWIALLVEAVPAAASSS